MDAETKQVLANICEILREQISDYAELETTVHCVTKTLIGRDASFHDILSEHIETDRLAKTRDVSLSTEETLRQLGLLIQQLKA